MGTLKGVEIVRPDKNAWKKWYCLNSADPEPN